MSNQSKKGTGREGYFAKYKSNKVYEANKKRKLERALKRNPNNEQIKQALKDIGFKRKKPKTPTWSPTQVRLVELIVSFTGKFDKNVFSSDVEAQIAAAHVRNEHLFSKSKPTSAKASKSMFSLAARAHDGKGNLVWAQ